MESSTFYSHIGLCMLSSLGGLFHIVYCCLFYTSAVGIWNAVLLLVTGVYGLLVLRPSPLFLVYSHCILFLSALVMLSLNSVGLHCTHRSCTAQTWSRPIQQRCLAKFADSPALLQGMSRVHTAIHCMMIVEALVQMGVALGVIWRHIFTFLRLLGRHVNEHYWHMLLGIMTFSFGTVHTIYCCHLFYIGSGVWCSLVIIISSVVSNYVHSLSLPSIQKADPGSNWALTSSRFSTAESDLSMANQEMLTTVVTATASGTKENIVGGSLINTHISRLQLLVSVLSVLSILAGFFLAAVGSFGAFCWHPVSSPIDSPVGNETVNVPWSCMPPSSDELIYEKCYLNLENYGFWDHESDVNKKGLARVHKSMTILIIVCGVLSSLFGLYSEVRKWKLRNQEKTVPTAFAKFFQPSPLML